MSYMDRAMKAKDRRYARVLGKLGYLRSDMAPERSDPIEPTDVASTPALVTGPKPEGTELDTLRLEYELVVGKKPHPKAKADTLRAKIAEAKG